MAKEPVRLTEEDWNLLFPEKVFPLGKTKLYLAPLNLAQIAAFKDAIALLQPKLMEHGITRYNYFEQQHIIEITCIVVEVVPDLLVELTGLCKEDLQKLPLNKLCDLVKFIITMNLESKEGLEKNFKALGALIKENLFGDLETQSNSSSPPATDGQTSDITPTDK